MSGAVSSKAYAPRANATFRAEWVPSGDERDLVLGYALCVSLVEDLAEARNRGLWSVDPVEMRAKDAIKARVRGGVIYLGGVALINELQSEALQNLFHIMAAASGGRVRMNVSTLIAMARRMSVQSDRYRRTPEQIQGFSRGATMASTRRTAA